MLRTCSSGNIDGGGNTLALIVRKIRVDGQRKALLRRPIRLGQVLVVREGRQAMGRDRIVDTGANSLLRKLFGEFIAIEPNNPDRVLVVDMNSPYRDRGRDDAAQALIVEGGILLPTTGEQWQSAQLNATN